MTSRTKRVLSITIVVVGILGTLATVFGLDDPSRTVFAYLLSAVALVALGYLWGIANNSIIEVFEHRPSFSLESELGESNEVWFAWHTGSVKFAEGDLLKRPRKIRMVLTHPKSHALSEVAKVGKVSVEHIAPGIYALTEAVKAVGGSVKWFDGFVANSIIISDPEKPSAGWARIEMLLPFGDPASRPSIRVRASTNPELFARVKNTFEALYNNSSVPP
ncbi:MAG: hypothetical protein HY356_09340 [Gammaproteobacteria bacterium]|nr:hypothetical protein [Gammaproteobacteria bacterium]